MRHRQCGCDGDRPIPHPRQGQLADSDTAPARSTVAIRARSRIRRCATILGRPFSCSCSSGTDPSGPRSRRAWSRRRCICPMAVASPCVSSRRPKKKLNDIRHPVETVFPVNNIGGGWPVIAESQGRRYAATVACLVSDGHTVYALTNRHVAGEAGEIIHSRLGGKQERIGVSSAKQLTRVAIHDALPGMAGARRLRQPRRRLDRDRQSRPVDCGDPQHRPDGQDGRSLGRQHLARADRPACSRHRSRQGARWREKLQRCSTATRPMAASNTSPTS